LDAGKGTGSPLTSHALPLAELLPQARVETGVMVAPVTGAAAAQPQAAQVSGETKVAPTAGVAPRSAPLRAPQATAVYRTLTHESAQMFERARDSVFKQVLFKLGKESSEVRMRLEPKGLGELDLQVSVQKG